MLVAVYVFDVPLVLDDRWLPFRKAQLIPNVVFAVDAVVSGVAENHKSAFRGVTKFKTANDPREND